MDIDMTGLISSKGHRKKDALERMSGMEKTLNMISKQQKRKEP